MSAGARKPNESSVTDIACSCHYLDRSAEEPLDDLIERFGKLDHDFPHGLGVRPVESDTEPSKIWHYRCVRYDNLSETAVVDLTDYGPERGVSATFQGKYVGRPTS